MAETQFALACPSVGHKTFEKSLGVIRLEETETPQQVSRFISPYLRLVDDLSVTYREGELQRRDLEMALVLFAHPQFIQRVFKAHRDLFQISQCRIYQFQTLIRGKPFYFGTFITDSQHNLIDLCIDTRHVEKRRQVLLPLIRAICTPASVTRIVARKFSH